MLCRYVRRAICSSISNGIVQRYFQCGKHHPYASNKFITRMKNDQLQWTHRVVKSRLHVNIKCGDGAVKCWPFSLTEQVSSHSVTMRKQSDLARITSYFGITIWIFAVKYGFIMPRPGCIWTWCGGITNETRKASRRLIIGRFALQWINEAIPDSISSIGID